MPSFNRMMKLVCHFDRKTRFLIINGLISLLMLLSVSFFPEKQHSGTAESEEASAIMAKSLDIISAYCRDKHININEINDPGSTGLIGEELSEITTTVGHLEAKRTTLNPNFAALITSWLMEAGVRHYDTIAIACSGSFPALMVASLSACNAMDLHSRSILSIGASSYGATSIDFTLLDIYQLLQDNGIVDSKPIAVSPGGKNDIGEEFDDVTVRKIMNKAERYGIPFIYESNLSSNLFQREALYCAGNTEIKAFINIGGGFANMGTSPLSLKLQPGLNRSATLPDKKNQGVIFSMLEKDIPVIHLLYIEGIARKYNLTWDPVSIPWFENQEFNTAKLESPLIRIMSILYLVYFVFILIRYYTMNNIK